jgi:hypothetical protein
MTLRRAAYHEAGHAVAYLSAGWPLLAVEIFDDGTGRTRGLERRSAPLTSAVIALSGPAAEARFRGCPVATLLPSAEQTTDYLDARALLPDPDQLRDALAAAVSLVEADWSRLAALAAVLIARRRLCYDIPCRTPWPR